MAAKPAVAVLGAGIMGSATALFLARGGARVTLFDSATAPFSGASRWNEGKIHLGYLYAGDPSLETARAILPGGLAFHDLAEALIGCPLTPAVTEHDDTYLVHRHSVSSLSESERYYEAVTRLAASHPGGGRYFTDLRRARVVRLSKAVLENGYNVREIVAGFRVPERSVSTTWLADRFVEALQAETRIELRMDTRVLHVVNSGASRDGPYSIETSRGSEGPFDWVVNALWEGRLAVDSDRGIPPADAWTHRYRLSVFLDTRAPVSLHSAVIATGPFGDVKNYGGRAFYLSWYPAGLLAEGGGIAPPPLPALTDADREQILQATLASLAELIPGVSSLRTGIRGARVEGGWVFAIGKGQLSDPAATLHRRERSGIFRSGSYYSVDTGKYSNAPWLAKKIALEILGEH